MLIVGIAALLLLVVAPLLILAIGWGVNRITSREKLLRDHAPDAK